MVIRKGKCKIKKTIEEDNTFHMLEFQKTSIKKTDLTFIYTDTQKSLKNN